MNSSPTLASIQDTIETIEITTGQHWTGDEAMHPAIKEIGGIIAAFIAWWGIAVLLGLMMYAIWPANGDHVAGISLEPQNVPGNVLGFVLALYAFRAVTRRTSKETIA